MITNGSRLTAAWMATYASYLDMLGVSFDAPDDATNFAQGRWPRGTGVPPRADTRRSERHLLSAARLARAHGVALKVNTVVTSGTAGSDVAAIINEAAPARWKVFQALALAGKNAGAGAQRDVTALLVPRAAFDAFVARNRAGLANPRILVPEPNDVMQSSYILLDERARFLDSSTGAKTPTRSILDVGVEAAARDLLGSPGGGHDGAAFKQRCGDFFSAVPAPVGVGPAAAARPVNLEVEVKFAVPPHLPSLLARLAASPPLVSEFTDVYYEHSRGSGYPLTTRDFWLRERSGGVELKWPASVGTAAGVADAGVRVDLYNESTDWPTIGTALDAAAGARGGRLTPPYPGRGGERAYMAAAGYAPFAALTTRRSSYAVSVDGHDVRVDVDAVRFLPPSGTDGGAPGPPLGEYAIGEVELMRAAPTAADPAAAVAHVLSRLLETDAAGLPPVRGKVLEYLARHARAHYAALGAAGLLSAKLGPRAQW